MTVIQILLTIGISVGTIPWAVVVLDATGIGHADLYGYGETAALWSIAVSHVVFFSALVLSLLGLQ